MPAPNLLFFDCETTGLPRIRYFSPEVADEWPYLSSSLGPVTTDAGTAGIPGPTSSSRRDSGSRRTRR